MREVTMVCRSKSRKGLEYYQQLHEELPKRGVRIAAGRTVRRRKDLQRAVRAAVKAGAETIVVIGGDGTQTAVVGELVHTKTALAVVPAGTGNSFALSIGIKDLEMAIDAIVRGKEQLIDVGIVNGTHFANFATIGLLAEAAAQTTGPLKRVFGPIAYGISAVREFFQAKPFQMRVKWKGGELELETYQAIIANGRYFGRQTLTPDAGVHSGELAFFAVEGASPGDAIRTNAALLRGEQTKLEGAHFFSAPKLEIRTTPKQRIDIDGHSLGKTPAKFKIELKALRVLIP
jgi:diacylglycerol kinase (ATP)